MEIIPTSQTEEEEIKRHETEFYELIYATIAFLKLPNTTQSVLTIAKILRDQLIKHGRTFTFAELVSHLRGLPLKEKRD